jgi:hypothetical protein
MVREIRVVAKLEVSAAVGSRGTSARGGTRVTKAEQPGQSEQSELEQS